MKEEDKYNVYGMGIWNDGKEPPIVIPFNKISVQQKRKICIFG